MATQTTIICPCCGTHFIVIHELNVSAPRRTIDPHDPDGGDDGIAKAHHREHRTRQPCLGPRYRHDVGDDDEVRCSNGGRFSGGNFGKR